MILINVDLMNKLTVMKEVALNLKRVGYLAWFTFSALIACLQVNAGEILVEKQRATVCKPVSLMPI